MLRILYAWVVLEIIWLPIVACLLLCGCDIEAEKTEVPDTGRAAVVYAIGIRHQINGPTPPKPADQCERCDGVGKYPIRDTGKWKDPCEVCNGTGKKTKRIPSPSVRTVDVPASPVPSVRWVSYYQAYQAGKPIILFFTGDGCRGCEVFKKKWLGKLDSRYSWVMVSNSPTLMRKWKMPNTIPSICIVNRKRNIDSRWTSLSGLDFARLLNSKASK